MKCSLGISNFLEEIFSLSILLFSSISLHWSLRKAFLSLLAILWNSAFRWVYLSFSPLPFTSLLFSAICKASSDNHFAFLHFFFLGMVLIPVSCTMLEISVQTFSGLIPWIYLSLTLYNSPWRGKGCPPQYSGLENSMDSRGLQRVRHDWAAFTFTFYCVIVRDLI